MSKIAKEAQVRTVYLAYERGMRAGDLTPDSQPAPWVVGSLERIEKGIEVTPETIDEDQSSGGTDHNDAWFT